MQHLLTIDVEQPDSALGRGQAAAGTDLAAALSVALDVLAAHAAHATFFVLAGDAAGMRRLLRRCVAEGHEVASHGASHRRVDAIGAHAFREDVKQSLSLIEDLVQQPCKGYRAPWFSAPPGADWYFPVLAELGVVYDSSLRIPLRDPIPAPAETAGVIEVPIPVLDWGAVRAGVLGGLALRLLPCAVIRALFARCAAAGRPACLYLHPYEWQAQAQADGLALLPYLRRRLLIGRTIPRLAWLTKTCAMISVEQWLRGGSPRAPAPVDLLEKGICA